MSELEVDLLYERHHGLGLVRYALVGPFRVEEIEHRMSVIRSRVIYGDLTLSVRATVLQQSRRDDEAAYGQLRVVVVERVTFSLLNIVKF